MGGIGRRCLLDNACHGAGGHGASNGSMGVAPAWQGGKAVPLRLDDSWTREGSRRSCRLLPVGALQGHLEHLLKPVSSRNVVECARSYMEAFCCARRWQG